MNIVLKVILAGAVFLGGGYAQKKWGIFDKAQDAGKGVCQKGRECFDKFKKKAEDVAEEAQEKAEEVVEEVKEEVDQAAKKLQDKTE